MPRPSNKQRNELHASLISAGVMVNCQMYCSHVAKGRGKEQLRNQKEGIHVPFLWALYSSLISEGKLFLNIYLFMY